MEGKELRKTIGQRAYSRRKELKLSQEYVAEKLGVNKSTILRYEKGNTDNTKYYILEGLANALDVSVDWLKGETDDMHAQMADTQELQIKDIFQAIQSHYPEGLDTEDQEFCKNILLLFLKEYESFLVSFEQAVKKYGAQADNSALAQTVGLDSGNDFNQMMFTREVTHTTNCLREMAGLIQDYSKQPAITQSRIRNLVKYFPDT